MQEALKRIYDYTLEEVMGDRFGRYAKEIIQDRAIPDVRDGLKPVQRRILYSMYKDHNTYDKPTRKSAKSVGNIMGNFHPHGDSSIYDAMVRMSQWWKQNLTYIEMQGNNGSMDGDSAAAMRYTEARLSKISNELLKDIDKNTVNWAPNFDDTELEPTVLPAKYPNLLVNGSTGISAGYATNIPPHNLSEIIDATVKRIDSPNCHLDSILDIVKGPDFPTGGIACGKKEIEECLKTGKGKVVVKSKYDFVKEKGKEQIVITEIPFEVNKALLVKKIDEIRIDKKVDGILEVRDESDRENLVRIVIDIKKEANKDLIINYLLKNTELQINYNYNMVAIVNRRPMLVSLIDILDAYIVYQKEVILKRTNFDLNFAKERLHIVEGLVKAISILDDVIKTIRKSKDKQDAVNNLVKEFDFSERQADAIVKLQLYRLTNFDVVELENEMKRLQAIISGLEAILSNEEKLKSVMKEELKNIKKEYGTPRKTMIEEEVTEIKIDTTEMIQKEDCIVVITNEGYVKRVSKRSFNSNDGDTLVKVGDYPIGIYEMNTLDVLLLFTNLGNYLYVPVHLIPDLKWKDLGKHVSNIIKLASDELIIGSIPVYDFDKDEYVTIFTKNGMVKRTKLSDFKVSRYTKPVNCMSLKGNDQVISITNNNGNEVFVVTEYGYGLRFNVEEISVIGLKGSGVKAISLKNDNVVSGMVFDNQEYLTVITDKSTGKRIKLSEFEVTSRARKGVQVVRDVKTNPYHILNAFITNSKNILLTKYVDDIIEVKITELPIVDRYSSGTVLSKKKMDSVSLKVKLSKKDDVEEKEEKVVHTVEQIDEKIMTIDDFLDDFKI